MTGETSFLGAFQIGEISLNLFINQGPDKWYFPAVETSITPLKIITKYFTFHSMMQRE